MIRSWFMHHPFATPFLIMENSTNEDTAKLLTLNRIPFIRQPGAKHELSVDIALDKVLTRYALLVDTDIVFLKSNVETINSFIQSHATLQGEVCGSRGGYLLHDRVNPWYCLIDLLQLREHDIHFNTPGKSLILCNGKTYDVGATMYEDCLAQGLLVNDIDKSYVDYKHYEGMSWRTQGYHAEGSPCKPGNNLSHADLALYELGERINYDYTYVGREPIKHNHIALERFF